MLSTLPRLLLPFCFPLDCKFQEVAAVPQAQSIKDMVKAAPKMDDDDYDFEDIETTKLRHGIKPRAQKRVVGHSWGEIALGTALSCGQMGVFGALMGLSVGAITGRFLRLSSFLDFSVCHRSVSSNFSRGS
jgi:hypothetical protein